MGQRHRTFSEIEDVARRLRQQIRINHLECPDLIGLFDNVDGLDDEDD
jgi:hypothetical protein